MNLVAMQVADSRRNLKMTVLRREGGTWHRVEVSRLANGLMTEVTEHPHHPEYLILFGHHTKEAISKTLGDGQTYTVSAIVGADNKELPFASGFAWQSTTRDEGSYMATYQYIYWRTDMPPNEKGEIFANVHLLVGYNQGYITNFQKMADKLRETFPQATNDKIGAGKVFKSSYVDGYSIITWDAYIPKGEYPGWCQKDTGDMEYFW